MKGGRLALTIIAVYVFALCAVEFVYARSVSLTTTIVITVKAPPKANIAPDDKNAEAVKELARQQNMQRPHIQEDIRDISSKDADMMAAGLPEDIKFEGGKVYTITDRL